MLSLLIFIVGFLFLSIKADTTGTANYEGCFEDQQTRILDQDVQDLRNTTNQDCVNLCRGLGKSFAGTENAYECYCGDERKNYTKVPDSECNIPCEGDSTQQCGGPWRISVYSTTQGNWEDWSAWSTCTATCAGGTQVRTRSCTDIVPNSCPGDTQQSQPCNQNSCAVHGSWGTWSQWSACDVTCGGGQRSQSRSCDNPSPSNGGLTCNGDALKYQTCNRNVCSGLQLCTSEWFTCKSDTSNCLEKELKCDCENHCSDGSDESRDHVGCGVIVNFRCNKADSLNNFRCLNKRALTIFSLISFCLMTNL